MGRISSSEHRIYAVDIGSTRGAAFAWAMTGSGINAVEGNQEIEDLARRVAADLVSGVNVALGFEAPMFLPVPNDVKQLSRGRREDGSRSCFAPAGGYVATLGLHQSAWILRRLKAVCGRTVRFSLSLGDWLAAKGEPVLFCWEAFVSGRVHSEDKDPHAHLRDAATAATWFAYLERNDRLHELERVPVEPVISLLGAAALWSGWASDVEVLSRPILIIKPDERYEGTISRPASTSSIC